MWDPSPLTLGSFFPHRDAPFTLSWDPLPSLLGHFHLSPQGPPSQSDVFPPEQGRELPTVTTSTLSQGLPLSTLGTTVLTNGRSLPTVTFSTLSQDPLFCPQRGVLLLTPGSPSPTMGSSTSDAKSVPS